MVNFIYNKERGMWKNNNKRNKEKLKMYQKSFKNHTWKRY